MLMGGLFASAGAQAELTLNAGLRLNQESNVNGSPLKSDELSDSYTSLNASAVYYTALDSANTTWFIGQAGAFASAYKQYSNLNNTGLTASAGLYRQLSETWSGQLTGRTFRRDFRQTERDSNGWGSSFELKKQLTSTIWVKGVADYEDSRAELDPFSYKGKSLGLNAGYVPRQDLFLSAGYNRTKRDFETKDTFETTTDAYFADLTWQLASRWYLSTTYSLQDNKSNIPNTAYKNHGLSIAATYSY